MMCAQIDRPGDSRLRFIFDGSMISRTLPANATFEDVALTLGALTRRSRGAPVAIDVTLATSSGRFAGNRAEY